MDTDRLRYFCAIADCSSLTRASEYLGVSHSGLSKAMLTLQNEVGFRLFQPKGRGLDLTEGGKAFYLKARQVLELIEGVGKPKDPGRKFLKIGLPEVLAISLSGALAVDWGKDLSIEELDSGEIEKKVLSRDLELGFTFIPFPHRDLDHLKICTVSLSSFAIRGKFVGKPLSEIPFVIPASEVQSNPLSIRVRDGWHSSVVRNTSLIANSLAVALRMVQSGVCAVYVPQFLVKQLNETWVDSAQLVELQLKAKERVDQLSRREIFMVKRADAEETQAMRKTMRVLRKICLQAETLNQEKSLV